MNDEGARLRELRRQVEELSRAVDLLHRPRLWVPPNATIGDGSNVDPRVTLWCTDDAPIRIGSRTRIYRGTEIQGPVTMGEGCMVNRDAYIRPHVTLGDRVFLGPFVRLVSDGHEIGGNRQRAGANTCRPIVVGDGTWIGASVTVVGGVTIGVGCVVAAGSVVVRDVPDHTLVAGVPAKAIRSLLESAP